MNRLRDNNYLLIQGWMVAGLGLKGNSLMIYAIIHGFTQIRGQRYTEGIKYLQDWTNSSSRGVIKSLNKLIEMGLISKEVFMKNNVRHTAYFCSEIRAPIVIDGRAEIDKNLDELSSEGFVNFIINGGEPTYPFAKNKAPRGSEQSSKKVVNKVPKGGELSFEGSEQSSENVENLGDIPIYINNNIKKNRELRARTHVHTREETEANPTKSQTSKDSFTPPSPAEVKEFCREKNIVNFDHEYFVQYYQTYGWKVGKKPMKNWRLAIYSWVKNDQARHRGNVGGVTMNSAHQISPNYEEI